MKNSIAIMKIGDLQIWADRSALTGSLLLWIVFSLAAGWLFKFSWGAALAAGLGAALLHWVSEIWHQGGHAFAARRTGYPMEGVQLWWLLGRSLYPKDEPTLPAEIHIRRALGGIPASLLLAAISGFTLTQLGNRQDMFSYLLLFLLLENIVVFSFGAALPLGFTDGSTLLYWLPRRKRP